MRRRARGGGGLVTAELERMPKGGLIFPEGLEGKYESPIVSVLILPSYVPKGLCEIKG
jgi:hypothetical protein